MMRWTEIFKQKLQSLLALIGIQIDFFPRELTRNSKLILRNNIDFIIAHHLLKKDKHSDFTFLQIGAFDGVTDDPIYRYVKKYGWKGTFVEPQESYYLKLQSNYSGIEGLQFLNVAISSERGKRTLYSLINPESTGLPEWAPQIASFSKESLLSHSRFIPDLKNRIKGEEVDCITFNDLVNRSLYDSFDLIQIDVEGYDYKILQMIDLDKISPNIIRFEHKHLSISDQNSAIKLLAKYNYKFVRGVADTIAYIFD